MKTKMRAALFYGGKKDIRVEEIALPFLREGDVLLKIRACGICGSDVRSYLNGVEERYKIPIIFGHEVVGEVAVLGTQTGDLTVGDRVVVAPIYGCGRCEFCLSGLENLCDQVVVFGCNLDGGYAEYMVIPREGVQRGVLVKLPSEISDEAGTLIEVFSCCLHGQRRVGIKPGDAVLIFGAGPIGLAHLVVSKKLGAGKVGVLDLVPSRLEEAKNFGADFVANVSEKDWISRVLNEVGKGGAPVTITAAPTVSSIENALQVTRKGGVILIFGGLPTGSIWSLNPNVVHYGEVTITGSIDATMDDFMKTVKLAPSFGLERFVTHRFSLENVREAMEMASRKEGLKVVLKMV
ncbi:MAG: alcohol dehydrogenase catalytic domain-containing protein [Candidatus Caldatribacteriaceae bacterium]